jgi:hypothetical protein
VREAETAFRHVQLRRGNPEIEEDACQRALAQPGRNRVAEILETRVGDGETSVGTEACTAVSHGFRILIQASNRPCGPSRAKTSALCPPRP